MHLIGKGKADSFAFFFLRILFYYNMQHMLFSKNLSLSISWKTA